MKDDRLINERRPIQLLNHFARNTQKFNRLLLSFVFYGFVGWIIETISILILQHQFISRGWLHLGLPFIPLYAYCCPILIKLLSPQKKNPLLIFIGSVSIITFIELSAGLILTQVFHLTFWDYSGMPPTIKGIISLPVSLLWGLLSLVLIYWIHPGFKKMINRLPMFTASLISWFLLVYLMVCYAIETYELFSKFFT
ncbi:putative ABC transporter permease [Parasporobacterium paucivorans]|uniref:Putative ABC-transporter type IV n=1 Tax=Parasporobacterium paucivorans DSM 15970 TaxID=1122934 RepID=A0A1M6JJQ5_9FIRM|nr:putative ABC transporter permease [Parasporobacterium paucivorans]SHJ46894.1 Putative ABC-transporter type IV [Parasporobacterium paucivorans DSM 15970]